MTRILIIRHGETEWNRSGKFQGVLDSPLTETGRLQAVAAGEALSEIIATSSAQSPWVAIYSSDLGRAIETARSISTRTSLPITEEPRLRERNLGIAQGLNFEEFKSRYPSECARFQERDPDYVVPEGESARQRHERSVSVVQSIADRNPDSSVVVVTHGGVLDSVFRHIVRFPIAARRTFSLLNAAINDIEVTGATWRLVTWGESRHLRDLGSLDDN